jgi:hypothetical protein
MSSADPDHKTMFLRNCESYEAAKERGESKEIQRFALLALNQIHLISERTYMNPPSACGKASKAGAWLGRSFRKFGRSSRSSAIIFILARITFYVFTAGFIIALDKI